MNLNQAQRLARALMEEHRLTGWSFRFDRARRRFGSCRWGQKVITLSRPLTVLNDEEQVRDTILHEIAHALTPGDGHGAKWKTACKRIGARPERCFAESEVVAPQRRPARYLIGCPRCDWWAERRRLTSAALVCRRCREPVSYRDRISGRQFRIEVVGRRRMVRAEGTDETSGYSPREFS